VHTSGKGNASWPVGIWNMALINSRTLPNCLKAKALADW
jgi:hypothetical protein